MPDNVDKFVSIRVPDSLRFAQAIEHARAQLNRLEHNAGGRVCMTPATIASALPPAVADLLLHQISWGSFPFDQAAGGVKTPVRLTTGFERIEINVKTTP